MANKYGYMAKIGIDTTGVQAGLSESDTAMKAFSREMREVNNVIREGGNSAEMAAQRNQLYAEQISQLSRRLEALKSVEEDINTARANGNINESEYRAYRREIEQTENALENLREQQRSIGENAGKDYDKVISALQNVEKVALATTGAVAAALGKLSSDALGAYSQYEQLVGGVETLFAGAEDIVLENAENAFKTAGISANNYMETVTGFSATLLQGLEGDTKKAAEIADQALIDMADNANKMGTAMESIQYAYQGFAKQNYTMLDNLKLGYGGSQAEMARLINDSGVLNGEIVATANNVKEIPFDKVIEAIHVIQENLGITGTTALEAETTLEGSMNKLKASWENALVDIAKPLDDFAQGGLTILNDNIDVIKDALVDMMEQIKPLLDDALVKLQEWIDGGGVQKLADGFVDTVEFVIDHKDLLLSLFAALEVALGADRISTAIKGFKDIKDAVSGVASVVNAASSGFSAFGIGLSGWIGIAAIAITTAIGLKEAIDNAAEKLSEHSDKVNELDEEYQGLNETLKEFNKLKEESIELANQEAATNLDSAKATAQGYKDQIDVIEKALEESRKMYGTNNLQGKTIYYTDIEGNATHESFEELSDQLGSLYHDYNAAIDVVNSYEETIEEAADNSVKHMGEVRDAAANSINNVGKTNREALDEVWANILDPEKLKAKMDEYDKELATHKIEEPEYWAKRKAYLESHRNEESEEWWKYYDKTIEEEKKAADKAAKEQEEIQKEADKKQKEAEDKKKEETKKAWEAAEREQQEKGYDDEWLLNEYQKILDTLDKGSDLYLEYYDKWLKLRNDIQNDDIKEWEESSKKTAESIKKAYEDVNKAQEQAEKDYLKSGMALGESVTEKGGKDRFVLNDLTEESKALEKYRKSMDELKATGISDDLLAGVMQFDYKDGSRQQFIDELLGMSEKQREQYYKDYAAYMAEVEKTGAYDVQDKLDEANQLAAQGVSDIYANMPDEAYQKGKETADSYLQGIIDSMSDYDSIISGSFFNSINGQNLSTSASAGTAGAGGDMVINFVVDGEVITTKVVSNLAQEYRRGGNPLNA